MNSCTRPQTCELLPSTTVCSFPNTSEEPQPMANRWKTSTSLTESQPYPKARELSSLQKQQNRNEFWDQSTDGQSRDTQNVSHRNSPGLREQSKKWRFALSKEDIHYVSKARCFRIGYNEVWVGRYGASGWRKDASRVDRKFLQRGHYAEELRAGLLGKKIVASKEPKQGSSDQTNLFQQEQGELLKVLQGYD